MGGGFLPPCHWKGPKSASAAVCQETLWVALRHSWTGLCSLSPLEISGGLLFGGCPGQRWVSLPFLLSSPGASRNTVGRIPGLLACEAPHTCPAFSPSGSASLTQALSSTCPSRSPPGPSPRKPTSPARAQSRWFSWASHLPSCSSQALTVHVCGVTAVLAVPFPHPHTRTGQHVPTPVAEGLAPAPETPAVSASAVRAQRPGDLLVRSSDSMCFRPRCAAWTMGDPTQLRVL